MLIVLTTLTLIFPNFTTTTPGPTFSTSQLAFAGIVSLILYGAFVFVQAFRHRDYFLPAEGMVRRSTLLHLLTPSRFLVQDYCSLHWSW
ncbi:MAG TPA: hypothetical protein VG498_16945 [Terriglobales bacterium]|nr:hypothetical protein [Terriglobales bacterium]